MTINKKIEKAKQSIIERFASIEAALKDLSPRSFDNLTRELVEQDRLLQAKYENRLMSIFLLIYHLRDDVYRLADRIRCKKDILDVFIKRSLPVTLCIRAGDTHKHGLGGRRRNSTITNGLLMVYRTPKGTKPSKNDKVIIIGMVLVDGKHGVFHSQVVIEQAIRDWIKFLYEAFKIDFSDWLERCLPNRNNEVIKISTESHATVPQGAKLVFDFKQDLTSKLVEDINTRVRES